MSKVISAAGVVVLKESGHDEPFEVLLLKRNESLKVHAGAWVFPGGKFDASDFAAINMNPAEVDIRQAPTLNKDELIQVAAQAAIRETFEEAGIELSEHDIQLHSRWLSPEQINKRFDTHFFMTITSSDKVTVDGHEIVDYQWISPSLAIKTLQNKAHTMPPATFVTLANLQKHETASQAFEALCLKPMYYRPKRIVTEAGFDSIYEEDIGYDSEDCAQKSGPRHRLIIDSGSYEYISEY